VKSVKAKEEKTSSDRLTGPDDSQERLVERSTTPRAKKSIVKDPSRWGKSNFAENSRNTSNRKEGGKAKRIIGGGEDLSSEIKGSKKPRKNFVKTHQFFNVLDRRRRKKKKRRTGGRRTAMKEERQGR